MAHRIVNYGGGTDKAIAEQVPVVVHSARSASGGVAKGIADSASPAFPWDRIAPNDPGHAPYRNTEAVRDVPWAAQLK